MMIRNKRERKNASKKAEKDQELSEKVQNAGIDIQDTNQKNIFFSLQDPNSNYILKQHEHQLLGRSILLSPNFKSSITEYMKNDWKVESSDFDFNQVTFSPPIDDSQTISNYITNNESNRVPSFIFFPLAGNANGRIKLLHENVTLQGQVDDLYAENIELKYPAAPAAENSVVILI